MNTQASCFHIVLIEPEIPPNTGNIARLCAATGTVLHLVGKLGFSLDDKHLKRAGLDYWPSVRLNRWENFEEFLAVFPDARIWYTSKKADAPYTGRRYQAGDVFVFGKETLGLPEEMLEQNRERAIRIPVFNDAVRSLNLSTAAGIVLYEALRQVDLLS